MSRAVLGAVAALAAILLAGGVALSALIAVRQPLATGDYVAIWGLKARALARSGDLSALFRIDPEGAYSHPEYPPLWPALLAVTAAVLGGWDDLRLTPLWPLLCLGASLATVRLTRGPWAFRLLAGAAVSLLPYYRRYPGYAEALLMVFVLLALAETDRLDASGFAPVRLAVFLTLAAWTKQEGAVAALVAGAVIVASGRVRAGVLALLSTLLFAVVPWHLYVTRAAAGESPGAFSASGFSPGKLLPAGRVLVEEAVIPHAAWILGAVLLLLLAPVTRRRRRGILWGAAAYSGLVFLSFAFSRFDPAWHAHWSWDRLALVPIAVVLVVLAEATAEAIAPDAAPEAA